MSKPKAVLEALFSQKLLPLYYHDDETTSAEILRALYGGGIRLVEYTNRGEQALDNFRALRKLADETMPGLYLGIGTIKTKKQARKFRDAGADFIIAPTINEEVAEVAEDAGLLWVPGCMTPTEIARAEDAGASLVKIFPGNILGPGYISAIKDLFPEVRFMPTGGVEAEAGNLLAWFKAGVAGVGMGSKLITKELVTQRNYEQLQHDVSQALAMVQQAAATLG